MLETCLGDWGSRMWLCCLEGLRNPARPVTQGKQSKRRDSGLGEEGEVTAGPDVMDKRAGLKE